jgi:Flp pilus assembly pilin Flp
MRKAQTALEYAVLIVCVVAALIAMQIYLKRGVSGRLRQQADSLGAQYSPGHTTSTFTITSNSKVTSTTEMNEASGVSTTTSNTEYDIETQSGTENVERLSTESLF